MDRMVYKNKKKKKNKSIFNLFFIVLILTFAVCIYVFGFDGKVDVMTQVFASVMNSDSNLLAEHTIAGQTLIDEADGYTTKFTTSNIENPKIYTEYKQNGESTWSENEYWGGTMSENGCGITSLAIIASGYGLDITPEDLRQEYYPHLDSEDISKALKKMGIKCSDFCFHDTYISKKYIADWLKTNRPVLVCVDNKKDDKWTASSHYMVILDVNEDGLFYVSNPNGKDGSEKASGWYKADEIIPYIVKALFVESY